MTKNSDGTIRQDTRLDRSYHVNRSASYVENWLCTLQYVDVSVPDSTRHRLTVKWVIYLSRCSGIWRGRVREKRPNQACCEVSQDPYVKSFGPVGSIIDLHLKQVEHKPRFLMTVECKPIAR